VRDYDACGSVGHSHTVVLNHGDRESHPFVLTSTVAEKCAAERGKRLGLTVERKDNVIQMFEIMSRGDDIKPPRIERIERIDMVSIIPE
jgi:hypothetical protein